MAQHSSNGMVLGPFYASTYTLKFERGFRLIRLNSILWKACLVIEFSGNENDLAICLHTYIDELEKKNDHEDENFELIFFSGEREKDGAVKIS